MMSPTRVRAQRGEDDGRGTPMSLHRVSSSSQVSSPAASGMSDSDTSGYQRASPEKLPPVGEVRAGLWGSTPC